MFTRDDISLPFQLPACLAFRHHCRGAWPCRVPSANATAVNDSAIVVARARGELAEHVEFAGRGRRLGLGRRGAVVCRSPSIRLRPRPRAAGQRTAARCASGISTDASSAANSARRAARRSRRRRRRLWLPPLHRRRPALVRRPTIAQRALGNERQPGHGRSRDDHSTDGQLKIKLISLVEVVPNNW